MSGDETQEALTRLALYKARKKVSSQDKRRRQLLEEQKRLRQDAFNDGRKLIEEFSVVNRQKKQKSKVYRQLLMNSEWLLDLPDDFEENWVMTPCPVGRRTLVVADGGKTMSFTAKGCVVRVHPSLLPAGNRHWEIHSKSTTILDCIWSQKNSAYYILDVLAWNNQPFTNCDTEFRFFWLKNKLPELEGISEKLPRNPHPFYFLPRFSCDRGTLETAVATHPLVLPDVHIDGLLFYHLQAQYVAGSTPLVLWLKPFMAVDFLHMTVVEELLWELPSDYKSYKHYIDEYETKRKEKCLRKRPRRKKKMDVDMEGDSFDSKTDSTLQDDEMEVREESTDDLDDSSISNLVDVELEEESE